MKTFVLSSVIPKILRISTENFDLLPQYCIDWKLHFILWHSSSGYGKCFLKKLNQFSKNISIYIQLTLLRAIENFPLDKMCYPHKKSRDFISKYQISDIFLKLTGMQM